MENFGYEYLESSCNVQGIEFGTGATLYENSILPAIESAKSEIILVTCFWAASRTRDLLNESLRKLNHAAVRKQEKIRVRVCFSSSSLLQKLFHTSSAAGRKYLESEWHSQLGLPHVTELQGLDMEVKSLFFRPFSVMHSKFVIIDRKHIFLPSCNVSWEDWFEGCLQLSGPIVMHFFEFWQSIWSETRDQGAGYRELSQLAEEPSITTTSEHRTVTSDLASHTKVENMRCIFLPSLHSVNPRFRLPWQKPHPAPQTPLNSFMLQAFAEARNTIYIQTPNITSPPVLEGILSAISRGVDIDIITSERLMILEQIITAGTTTSLCLSLLIGQYKALCQRSSDEESRLPDPGQLRISYYEPRSMDPTALHEPVQSHVKLTMVDQKLIVFGSGNMDRASWYTSQELDVAFFSKRLSASTQERLLLATDGRTKLVYDSRARASPQDNILVRLAVALGFQRAGDFWNK